MSHHRKYTASAPSAASILTLLAGIEARSPSDPATLAFRSAIARAGREARAAGGFSLMRSLMRQVRDADLGRAAARTALLRETWGRTRGERGGVAVRLHRMQSEGRAAA